MAHTGTFGNAENACLIGDNLVFRLCYYWFAKNFRIKSRKITL